MYNSPEILSEAMGLILEVRELQEQSKRKGQKYTVLLDGEVYCRCYLKDLAEAGIKQEEEVAEEQLERLNRNVFLPRAKRRSLYLLNKKRYTRKEMISKLKTDGYPDAVVEDTLSYLEKMHYVEDISYAKGYAFYLLQRCSEREAYQKMIQKGFEREIITEAFADAKATYYLENGTEEDTESPEIAAIRSILRKKGVSATQMTEEKKRKLVMSLYRKGFLLSDIKHVLGELDEIEELSGV